MKMAHVGPFANQRVSMSNAEQMEAIQADAHAQAKLRNRLTIVEYCCYMVRKIAPNLDAFARAKSVPKTKSYALDADAVEDPTAHRIVPEEGQNDFLDDVPDNHMDGDVDDFVRLKAGDAPDKVPHPLIGDTRLKVLTFFRERTSKFVRDMISAGLLPLTSGTNRLEQLFTLPRATARVQARGELQRVQTFAKKLPKVSKDILDKQRAAFERASPKENADSLVAIRTLDDAHAASPQREDMDVDAAIPEPEAQWQHLKLPSTRME